MSRADIWAAIALGFGYAALVVAAIGRFMGPTISRDPIADGLLAKYQRESAILKEVRRVCGVKHNHGRVPGNDWREHDG